MSEQSNSPEKVPSNGEIKQPVEFDMVKAYRKKMTLLGEKHAGLAVHNEPLSLVLDKAKIESIMNHKDFDSLIAFFAVANPDDPLSKSTLVITGRDKDGKVLTYERAHEVFAVAQQTWSMAHPLIDTDETFEKFFIK